MAGTMLLSYDVERIPGVNPPDEFSRQLLGYVVDEDATSQFVGAISPLLRELDAPCTLFITGMTLERYAELLQPLVDDPHLDLQQHSYSHVPFKTIVEERDDEAGTRVLRRAAPLEQVIEEVWKTQQLFAQKLGIACLGITCPFGHYRGLSDRPEILQLLHGFGLRYVRSFARTASDYQPLSVEVQPFWYDLQGLPEMLEIPIVGWHDVGWKMRHGWEKTDEYLSYLRSTVDAIADRDLVWSVLQHDWSSIQYDPELTVSRELIAYARNRGVELLSHTEFYKRKLELDR